MESSFIYAKPVSGKYFVGRKSECTILSNLLGQGENVVIYEPAKAGKTSLIQQSFINMRMSGSSFSIVNLSLINTRTVADFMLRLGSELLKLCCTTPSDFATQTEALLQGTHFVFDEQFYAMRGNILSLNWDIDQNDINSILTLPYRLATQKGQKIFVVLDDFQNILLTEDGEKLLKTMECTLKEMASEFKGQACYLFCGSQINAMKYIFEDKKFFHRQVERVKINPIDEKSIADAITRVFLSNGKVIDRDLMLGVCKLFKCNIWYISHFASICDGISRGYIMEPLLEEALDCIISIHEPRFRATMNDLTTFQVCLLRAIVDGYTKFSSAEVIERYSLNSSANVNRLKDALCKKEIISFEDDVPFVIDPLFEYWIRKYFFEIK